MVMTDENVYTVADAVVEELVHAGVEVVFGIVSIHNMPIYDAILRDGRIHVVTARGESGAVNMADGYARVTGKLGVAITSTGTGAGNAAGSLVEAWSAGTKLLHLTGEVASPYLGTGKGYIHEMKDQLQMMEGCCKHAFHLRIPEQAIPMMRKAIAHAAFAPSGPVTLQIPIDYQSAIIPKPVEQAIYEVKPLATEINPLPEEIVAKIVKAKRPVIWAGGGVIHADAAQETTRLAEKLGAAVITSQSGKGAIPEDHPLCIGHFASFVEVQKLLEKADLLISMGVRFRSNETASWKVKVNCEHINIDVDYLAHNRNYQVTHSVVGDIKQILQQLLQQLAQHQLEPEPSYQEEVTQARKNVRKELRSTLGPYEQFVDGMRKLLPKDAILVRDVTVPANLWGSRLFEIYQPRTSIHAAGGGIGQGLPTAIGAQLGAKEQVVMLMVGDGGFMVNVGELATAVEEQLPLIIALFDDGGYGVLRNLQDAAYGRRIAVDLLSPNFVKLGEAMGFVAKRVGSAVEFLVELDCAIQRRKPSLIVVDMKEVGPMKKPFGGPPGAAEAFRPKKLS